MSHKQHHNPPNIPPNTKEEKLLKELLTELKEVVLLQKAEVAAEIEQIRLQLEESRLLRQELRSLRGILEELKEIELDVRPPVKTLTSIKIALTKVTGEIMFGPFTLKVGDTRVASVKGFDQDGNEMVIDFVANPVSFSNSDGSVLGAVLESDPSLADITALAKGTSTLGATCAGLSTNDADNLVTVTEVGTTPVLTTIKLDLAGGNSAAAKKTL